MLPKLSTVACSGCRLSLMSESETDHGSRLAPSALAPHHDGHHEAQANAPRRVTQSPKRRPGAPCGNRNALKHGRYSAAAQAARAAARARLLTSIPDPDVHSSRWQALAGGGGSPLSSAFKGNNYVAPAGSPQRIPLPQRGEGLGVGGVRELQPPAPPSPRRRGAPPGNGNALKHGRHSAKRRALWKAVHGFMRAVRACLAEVDARPRHGRQGEVRAAMLRVPNHRERPPHAA